jgi:hypothetical protein
MYDVVFFTLRSFISCSKEPPLLLPNQRIQCCIVRHNIGRYSADAPHIAQQFDAIGVTAVFCQRLHQSITDLRIGASAISPHVLHQLLQGTTVPCLTSAYRACAAAKTSTQRHDQRRQPLSVL